MASSDLNRVDARWFSMRMAAAPFGKRSPLDDVVERHRRGMATLRTGREAATRPKKTSTKAHGARLGNVPAGDGQPFAATGDDVPGRGSFTHR